MIRISEIFGGAGTEDGSVKGTIQGEGLFVGVPSIFIRTFGCNFTCPGFGLPLGQKTTLPDEIDISKYNKLEDLPIISEGCDSYYSWHKNFKKYSPMMTIDEIVEKVKVLLPDGKFTQDIHLVMTGGEPLLGWQRQYIALFNALKELNLSHITFETNGTKRLTPEFFAYLKSRHDLTVTFSISAKLPCSGEAWEDAIKPDVIKDYLNIESSYLSYFKFVVATEQDVHDALKAIKEYRSNDIDIPVYLMPVGGTDIIYNGNKIKVVDLCVKYGLRYSPRLHVDIWSNEIGR